MRCGIGSPGSETATPLTGIKSANVTFKISTNMFSLSSLRWVSSGEILQAPCRYALGTQTHPWIHGSGANIAMAKMQRFGRHGEK